MSIDVSKRPAPFEGMPIWAGKWVRRDGDFSSATWGGGAENLYLPGERDVFDQVVTLPEDMWHDWKAGDWAIALWGDGVWRMSCIEIDVDAGPYSVTDPYPGCSVPWPAGGTPLGALAIFVPPGYVDRVRASLASSAEGTESEWVTGDELRAAADAGRVPDGCAYEVRWSDGRWEPTNGPSGWTWSVRLTMWDGDDWPVCRVRRSDLRPSPAKPTPEPEIKPTDCVDCGSGWVPFSKRLHGETRCVACRNGLTPLPPSKQGAACVVCRHRLADPREVPAAGLCSRRGPVCADCAKAEPRAETEECRHLDGLIVRQHPTIHMAIAACADGCGAWYWGSLVALDDAGRRLVRLPGDCGWLWADDLGGATELKEGGKVFGRAVKLRLLESER